LYSFLLKIKQINDVVLNKLQQKRVLTVLPQRLLIIVGAFLEYFIRRVSPDDRTLAELKKTKQQFRFSQPPYVPNRQSSKADPSIKTRQSVVVTKHETVATRTSDSNILPQPDYSNSTDKDLYSRLANSESIYNVDTDEFTTEPIDLVTSGDIAQLHAQIKPSDVQLLYSRLPADILTVENHHVPLNEDQQQLHARIIGAEHKGHRVNEDDE